MHVHFLGTNGWFDSATGNTTCVLIETAEAYVVFDAGYGLAKLDRYIYDDKPLVLFLSHFHLDHVVGFHTLAKFHFPQGLRIVTPQGGQSVLDRLINHPFTIPHNQLPYTVTVTEWSDTMARLPFRVSALPLRHASLTLGYRLEADGLILSYCADTGYCQNAVTLAQGADLVITECSFPSGQRDDQWGHLNPETAARIAREAGAKRLALIHFDARLYTHMADRHAAAVEARRIFPDVLAANDDLTLVI